MLDFTWRLYGVRQRGERLEWNCRLPEGSQKVETTLPLKGGDASLVTTPQGSELRLNGRRLARVSGAVRLVTDGRGALLALEGTQGDAQSVRVEVEGHKPIQVTIAPDEVKAWDGLRRAGG